MIVFWCSPPALTTTTHLAADPGDVDVLLALLDERAPELSDDLAASSPVKEDMPNRLPRTAAYCVRARAREGSLRRSARLQPRAKAGVTSADRLHPVVRPKTYGARGPDPTAPWELVRQQPDERLVAPLLGPSGTPQRAFRALRPDRRGKNHPIARSRRESPPRRGRVPVSWRAAKITHAPSAIPGLGGLSVVDGLAEVSAAGCNDTEAMTKRNLRSV